MNKNVDENPETVVVNGRIHIKRADGTLVRVPLSLDETRAEKVLNYHA